MSKFRDSLISTPKDFFEIKKGHINSNEINSKFQLIKNMLNSSIKQFW